MWRYIVKIIKNLIHNEKQQISLKNIKNRHQQEIFEEASLIVESMLRENERLRDLRMLIVEVPYHREKTQKGAVFNKHRRRMLAEIRRITNRLRPGLTKALKVEVLRQLRSEKK